MKNYTDTEILNWVLTGGYQHIMLDCANTREKLVPFIEDEPLWDKEYPDSPCKCKCTKYRIRDNVEYCCFCGAMKMKEVPLGDKIMNMIK